MKKLASQKEADIVRGKLLVGHATDEEQRAFLDFAAAMEALLDEADCDDYFGTEGWRRRLGWDS